VHVVGDLLCLADVEGVLTLLLLLVLLMMMMMMKKMAICVL